MSIQSIKLGDRGKSLIKSFETLKLEAYLPTPNDVPTIGWGHTRGVKLGDKINKQQADAYFDEDVADSIAAVERLRNRMGKPLTQAMADALVSLVFNAGEASISPMSTVGGALISGDYFKAWRGMALWTKQASKDMRGLARRRALEMALFMEDKLPG